MELLDEEAPVARHRRVDDRDFAVLHDEVRVHETVVAQAMDAVANLHRSTWSRAVTSVPSSDGPEWADSGRPAKSTAGRDGIGRDPDSLTALTRSASGPVRPLDQARAHSRRRRATPCQAPRGTRFAGVSRTPGCGGRPRRLPRRG